MIFEKKGLFKIKIKKQRQVVDTKDLIYFCRPPLGYTISTSFTTFQTVDQEICSNLIFYKTFRD